MTILLYLVSKDTSSKVENGYIVLKYQLVNMAYIELDNKILFRKYSNLLLTFPSKTHTIATNKSTQIR